VLSASSVGGGSIAYGGLLEPPRDAKYWHARHPELDPDRVQNYYSKIFQDMGAVSFDRDSCVPQSIWDLVPDGPDQRCQVAKPQPRMGMLLPPSEEAAGRVVVSGDGLERQYCKFNGDSFLGSRGGAKASVDFIYLAPVVGQGAQVRDLCEVTGIWRAPAAEGGGYAIHFKDLIAKRMERVRAKRVVLAAGTMNTLRLLFISREKVGGLRDMPALGRTFGANGDLLGTLSGAGDPVSSFQASPSMGAFTVDGCDGASMGVGGFPGLDTLPLPKMLKNGLGRTYFMYGMGADSGSGSVRFHKGRLQVEYDQALEPIYEEIRSAFKVMTSETGRKTWAIGKPLTMHPWGGACVGAEHTHGVVDHRGEVYGNPGLFITDGSVLPAAPGGPPSLAIAAWAHYVADGMAENSDF
jgi:cholesterol oxidase